MGWKFNYYNASVRKDGDSIEPADTLDDRPGLPTIYLRPRWSAPEPRPQQFG
jgi:hypothetical protein